MSGSVTVAPAAPTGSRHVPPGAGEEGSDVLGPHDRQRTCRQLDRTARELDLLVWLCDGQPDKQSRTLELAQSRVRTYLGRLYLKLGVHSRAGAMAQVLAECRKSFATQTIEPGPSCPEASGVAELVNEIMTSK